MTSPTSIEGAKVAELPAHASLQPPSRVRVLDRVAAILDGAPTHEPSGFPTAYSHRSLGRQVYATDDPTAAQLSAVRRAVAKLVAEGRAERDPDRRWDVDPAERLRYRSHERVRGG